MHSQKMDEIRTKMIQKLCQWQVSKVEWDIKRHDCFHNELRGEAMGSYEAYKKCINDMVEILYMFDQRG